MQWLIAILLLELWIAVYHTGYFKTKMKDIWIFVIIFAFILFHESITKKRLLVLFLHWPDMFWPVGFLKIMQANRISGSCYACTSG